ncbi:MAG: baseplate J/gp47 family protein [Psychromonas sp.]
MQTSTQRSLKALIDRATATLITQTQQNNPAINAIANTIAAVSYGQYGYQDQLFRELNPETASEEWLYVHAKRYNAERLSATFSSGLVQFKSLDSPVEIPLYTLMTAPSGNEFETIKSQLSDEDIEIIALSAGSASNLPSEVTLTLSKSISGINPDNITCLGLTGGAEIEDLEHWRARIVSAFNESQTIGKRDDYESWAVSAHSDVDFAWALDNTALDNTYELGVVQVLIGARENDPTLSSGVIDIVQDFIEQNRLAGCHADVVIPTHKLIDIEIQNVQDETIRADIVVALESLFKEKMGVRDETVFPPSQVSITPTEIVLAIAPITSNYIVKQPTDEQFITNSQIHVLGEVVWTPLS